MFKLTSVLISSGNAKELQSFYEKVFEKPVDEMQGWLLGNAYFVILEHSEVHGASQEGPRVMFNLETPDVKAEFDRVSKIEGVKIIKEPYQMEEWDGWISTLADPEGNYFQLMSPWEDNK